MNVTKKLSVIFVFLVIISKNQLVSSDSWPMFLNDPQHTGNSTSIAPDTNVTLWSVPTIGGNGYSSPVVANGRVFVNRGGTLYSLFENNGTEIWNQTIGFGGFECSTPAVADGKVYVVGNRVLCFYENNGTEIWNKTVTGFGTGTSSPTVADGKVFVNTGTLYCFYANNGTEIWNISVGGSRESTPAVANGKVFVDGQNLYCLYADNGTEIWNISGGASNSPAIANGKVFYNPGPIICLYENNGSEIWSQPNGGDGYSSPAVANGKVFVHTSDRVKCYYENNGTEIWDVPILGQGCSTPAISSNGKVFVNAGNSIYCFNESNGAEIWSYITGGEGFSSPAIANGRVFVNQGTVYCFGSSPLTVDYILIRDAPGGGGKNLCDPANFTNLPVGNVTEFYGAAYNNTAGYIGDVDSASSWNCSDPTIVNVSSPGSSSIITCNSTRWGTVAITLDDGNGHTNVTQVTVLKPTINYIVIRTGPNGTGNWVGDSTYIYGGSDIFFSAGYNDTAGWVEDVPASWNSDYPLIGYVDPGPSNSTNFVASNNGTCNITATYNSFSNSTGVITIINFTIDYIIIRDELNNGGSWVGDRFFGIDETVNFYAAAYNFSVPGFYLGDVSVDWQSSNSLIGTVTSPGISTVFTAQLLDGECNVTATYDSLITNTTGKLNVIPPTIDYIIITDSPNGNELTTVYLNVGESIRFYASGYNNTGPTYVDLADVNWSQFPSIIGSLNPFVGNSSNFTAGMLEGSTTITGNSSLLGLFDNFTIVINKPTVDHIQIRDAPGGLGNIVTTGMYSVFERDEFYVAAYNNTTDYLYDVEVVWSSDNPNVGQVTSPGIWTNFTAQRIDVNSPCTITATFQDIICNSTGLLTVLAPRVDFIQIRDAPGGEGNISTEIIFMIGGVDTVTYYCAAYNRTVDYIGDKSARWTVTGGIGTLSLEIGVSTNFIAMTPGIGVIIANLTGITNSTGEINVFWDDIIDNLPKLLSVEALDSDKIKIEWEQYTLLDFVGIIILRSQSSEGPWQDVATVGIETTSYTDTGLEPDTTYYYRIIAIDNASNESPPSGALSATTFEDEEIPWIWLLIIIIIIVILLLLFFIFKKRKPKKVPTEPEGEKESPLPPSWIKTKEELPSVEEEEPPPPDYEIPEEGVPPPDDEEGLPPPEDEIPEDELPPPEDEMFEEKKPLGN